MAAKVVTKSSSLPKYPEMILAAVSALDEKIGSNKSTISKYIESQYGELPPGYTELLSHHLNKMKATGELVMVKNNYMRPNPNDPPRRGRGRPPKPKVPLPPGTVVSPPRPRGRPPKDKDPSSVSSPKVFSVESSRSRGRPPKKDKPVVATTTTSTGTSKKRGRPPKSDAPTECNEIKHGCTIGNVVSEFTTSEIFKSRDAIIEWTRQIGKRSGFVIVIKSSESRGERRKPRLTFACERHGFHKSMAKKIDTQTEKGRKMTGTKKCGCPFKLKGLKLATADDWELRVICAVHNHPAANHLEGHSYAGRLSQEEHSLLVDMSKSMLGPKEIFKTLKDRDPLNVTTMKTIYNARQRYKVAEKTGRSQIQDMIDG